MRLRKIHDVEKCYMLSHMMMWTICVHSVTLNFVLFKICIDPRRAIASSPYLQTSQSSLILRVSDCAVGGSNIILL